jgi:uncharacterized protein YegP (UPF0339 family)
MWVYTVYVDDTGSYRWRLTDGKTLAVSVHFPDRATAVRTAQEFKAGAWEFESFHDLVTGYGWRALATNGEIVASSDEGFVSEHVAEQEAAAVRQYAPEAVGPRESAS